ncbi:hypothetical protein PspLS_11013 [Pyricularia sp. CBS 133598]|nr:hypothetical protein PspLS_11013 [Pyricularia sp. CBS 133598]
MPNRHKIRFKDVFVHRLQGLDLLALSASVLGAPTTPNQAGGVVGGNIQAATWKADPATAEQAEDMKICES